jgi:carboxypeptidase C (cathepsin A)
MAEDAGGQPDEDGGPHGGKPGGGTAKSGKAKEKAEPVDDLVETRHAMRIGDRELGYTVRTGRIVLREEVHDEGRFDGYRAKAEVFVVAYTLDDTDARTRPLTFAFNGGPGSASVWLHLGLLGPRRVVTGDVGGLTPPPYELVDNAESLLTHSDLVFIDPVSTGYSRAADGEKPQEYHGYQGDLDSVGEIIRLWVSRNGRWMSPKYLCGESYGTMRAAALADLLQDRFGMYLNGLMLVSALLDLGTLEFNPGNDRPYPLYLPTYAAIAHYHGKHGDRPLADVLAEAAEFAERDYPHALARGARLSTVERSAIAARLAELTGLDADYVDRVDLRIEHTRFFAELMRRERRIVGRLDSRYLGWDTDYGREQISADPFIQAIRGPYSTAINHYLRVELGYENDLPYEVLSGRVHPWSFKEFENRYTNASGDLASAMRTNPHLRVHVACGYFDGGTPHAAIEETVAQLPIPAELRANIEFHYYESGHMMYIHEPSRLAQSAHLAEFVRAAE